MDATTRSRAQALIVFMDGLEGGALTFLGDGPETQPAVDVARRSRAVARDLLRALDELDAERSGRRAMQAERDRVVEILARHAAEACG